MSVDYCADCGATIPEQGPAPDCFAGPIHTDRRTIDALEGVAA